MNDIVVKVKVADAKEVVALTQKQNIPFQSDGQGWTSFTLPKLGLYEVVVLEST